MQLLSSRRIHGGLQELCLDRCGIGNAGATVLGLALGGGAVKKSKIAGEHKIKTTLAAGRVAPHQMPRLPITTTKALS